MYLLQLFTLQQQQQRYKEKYICILIEPQAHVLPTCPRAKQCVFVCQKLDEELSQPAKTAQALN